jgi:ElaB/YqjD/DUF883 family membrane-anchored ribosome-binding protein
MDTNTLDAQNTTTQTPKDQLITHFKTVIADAEAILRASASQSGESLAALRQKAEESLAVAKDKLTEAQTLATEKGRAAVQATDRYVHESPWTAVSIAAGVGLLVGILLNRR